MRHVDPDLVTRYPKRIRVISGQLDATCNDWRGAWVKSCHLGHDRGRVIGDWVPSIDWSLPYTVRLRDKTPRILINLKWYCEKCEVQYEMTRDIIPLCEGVGEDGIGHKGGLCTAEDQHDEEATRGV